MVRVGAGGVATALPGIYSFPWGVAVGPDGSVYVTNAGNSTVVRVGAGRVATTLPGTYS